MGSVNSKVINFQAIKDFLSSNEGATADILNSCEERGCSFYDGN